MATSLINTANLHNNTYANASKNNNNAGINTKFTAADFQRWNQTTSVVHIPSRLVRNSKIPQLRKELIHAVGERKVSAVQALSPIKYNIQYKHSSDRHAAEINGITFRGVHLTPLPAYEEVKSVFVEKAPLHMQDNYLYEALAPYGRVIGVQHLTIKGFPTVRSGTRRVSMVVTKAIPRTINIGGFPVVFNYRGQPTQCYVCQEVGHASKDCPNSRQGRKLQQQQQQQQNLPKTTGTNKAQQNTKQSINKANNNNKPALGHDDLKIKLDGAKRTVQTTQNKKKSPLGETDLRNKLNKKQGVVLKSSETEPSPASKSLPTKSKAGRAKGQSLPKGRSSATDDVIVDEVARSPNAVAESMDTQPSQETSLQTTSPPAQHLATLRKMFNVPPTSDDEIEPGEIRDSSSIQSMDDERSSDHADPKTKLDGATKSIQSKSEADSPLRVQSHSTSPPLTQQLKELRSKFNMPTTSASESEGITEADFAASIITAEQQAAAAKSGQVRTAVRTVTTLRVRRRRSGPSQATTPAIVTTTTSRSSSTITTSTWTKPTGGRTKVTATQAEIDRDDIPLAVLRKNKRRRLNSITPPKDEELDCCLSGSSVIDPLAIEYWQTTPISSFGQTPSLPALEAPSATSNVALQQEQQQQTAEDMSLVPLDGTLAIPATAPEPEVTLDPMATPFGALMQEEEEILIQVRDEGEVSWASEVASDPRGTPPLVGVEIGILEPGQIGPDPSSFYDPLVVPISPPGGEVTPISSPVQINTPVFYRPSVDGDESPPGSVASSTDFLPSPASSQGLFDRLVCGAPDDAIASAREPTTIDEINRAILTELSSPELPLSPEFLPLTLESNDEFDFSQHQRS